MPGVEAIALTDFVHDNISASEGKLVRYRDGAPIRSAVAGELERAGLVRIRTVAPITKQAPGKTLGRWVGSTIVCVASGPSLTEDDLETVRRWRDEAPANRRVIVVNATFRRAPWADALYFGDLPFWNHYGAEVERTFTGELWTCCRQIDGAHLVDAADESGLSTRPGRIHRGGNSGYQAVNLAFMLGPPALIVLLGYDMQLGPKGETHHHGRHSGLSNPTAETLREWARRFIQLGADLRAQGVEVVNATRRTAITCFECAALALALRDERFS